MKIIVRIACALAILASLEAPAFGTTVTFIHHGDLHAHLTPHPDLDESTGIISTVTRGGLARIATLVNQIRASNPASIAMDPGDTYHGGVEALFSYGNDIVDPVNAVGYDVGVPGNWDFAYGPDVTRLRYVNNLTATETRLLQARVGKIKRPTYPELAANITFTAPASKAGQPFLPATLIKTVGGVKVGIIGISSDIVPLMDSTLATGLAFVTGETNYKTLIETNAASLRAQGCKIVVVLSHLGIHKDYRLAQIIAKGSVDVFFSGHTHEAVVTPLTSDSGALVVEAGNDGYVGRMDVTVDSTGKVTARNWTLIPVDASIPDNPTVAALVATARAPYLVANPNLVAPGPVPQTLHQSITTVVASTLTPLSRRYALENPFNRAYTDRLRQMTGTDFAMTPGFRFDAVDAAAGTLLEDNTVASGAITLEDLYRFFPVAYNIATGQTTGAQLKTVMEQGMESVFSLNEFSQNGGWFEGFAGLKASVDLRNPSGQRVLSLADSDTGAPIDPAALYTIAGCQRPNDDTQTLCSYSGFQNVTRLTNPATGSAWTIVDMATTLFASGAVTTPATAITDVSNTSVWPVAPFIQPLAENVSDRVSVAVSGLVYDSVNKVYNGTVAVNNPTSVAIAGPVKVELNGLTTGVTLVNSSGTHDGTPFVRSSVSLGAGATVSVPVVFSNSGTAPISYTVKTYAGGI
jgi:S-sulfosulfanyl-L-cysteine sulfohydrolase